MSFTYYIKNRVIDYYPQDIYLENSKKKKIKDLLDNIYNCCKTGNIGVSIQGNEYHYKKVHKKNVKYKIPTDIKFTDLDVDLDQEFDYVKNTKRLSQNYIKESYLKSQNIVLIAFDENDKIYTILTFFYNIFEDCIEVDAFWSNDDIPGGGSIMMNFLINAVKCGINLCDDPRIYTRKIILSSVHDPATINFYKNFKFIEIKENTSKPTYLVPFTRNLSTGSADLNDNHINRIIDEDEIIELLKKQHQELSEQLKHYEDKLPYIEIIRYYLEMQDLNLLTEEAAQYMYENNIKYISDIPKLSRIEGNLYKNIYIIKNKIQTVLNKIKEMENIDLNTHIRNNFDFDKKGGKNKRKNKTKRNAKKMQKNKKQSKKIKNKAKKYI